MSTNLERMEDDIQAMVENLVSEALATALTRLDERIEKIERFIAFLGPLALLSERLTRCEGLLVHHGLDIGTNSMNVEALVEEHKLQGTINASLQGQVNGLTDRVNTQLAMISEALAKIANLEQQLEAEAEAEALALHGGEQ